MAAISTPIDGLLGDVTRLTTSRPHPRADDGRSQARRSEDSTPASADEPPNDEALVARILTGDQIAAELLHYRWQKKVHDWACRILQNTADADECAQEVFSILPIRLRKFTPGSFGAWLKEVVENRARDFYRARKKREAPLVDTSAEDLDISSGAPSQEQELAERQEQVRRGDRGDRMWRFLRREVTPQTYRIFILRLRKDEKDDGQEKERTFKEVAEILTKEAKKDNPEARVPEATVYTRYSRTVRRMVQHFFSKDKR